MSENFMCDVTLNMGKDRTEASWFKFKLGKGAQEIAALKNEVQSGSGQQLGDGEHIVAVWFPADAEVDSVTELIEGMAPGDDAVNVVDDVNGNGKWVLLNVNKAAGDGDEGNMLKDVDTQLEEFFSNTENNAFLEVSLKSAMKSSDMLEIAQNSKEAEVAPGTEMETFPSFMSWCDDMQFQFRADMDHKFLITVMTWASKFGVKTDAEFFEFIKKFNHLSMKLNLNSFRNASYNTTNEWIKEMWNGLHEGKEMFAEMDAFKSMCNKMRMVFIVKDQAYLNIDMNFDGFGDYIAYWC